MLYQCYINGKRVAGRDGEKNVINPGTEEVIGQVSLIDEEQAKEALIAAQKGFAYWSGLTIREREEWINRLKLAVMDEEEEIVDLLMMETGKLYGSAKEDYQMLIDCFDFFTDEAKNMEDEIIRDAEGSHHNIITREPIGVVVAYLAWNFPLLNLGYKLGPVLASGCSCVIRPSESTPLATLKIGEILEKINFPKGVVNLVLGDVSKISHVLNSSDITQLITLIGSTNTGKKVINDSTTSIKRFSLELGGNAPAIVLKDYDEKKAARILTHFKFANCGQVCVSPNRIFVHEDQYESFVHEALEVAQTIKAGWGKEEGASISPMISKRARDRMFDIVEDALQKGARLVYGGKVPEEKDKGFYMMPTVLADVTKDMKCYQEEIFGPIMPILKYNDQLDLIEAGNDTEYGLTSYVFSNDMKAINQIAKGLKAGTVCVNKPKYAVELPHGGIKESGIGKDCSKYSLEEYYYIKRISIAMD